MVVPHHCSPCSRQNSSSGLGVQRGMCWNSKAVSHQILLERGTKKGQAGDTFLTPTVLLTSLSVWAEVRWCLGAQPGPGSSCARVWDRGSVNPPVSSPRLPRVIPALLLPCAPGGTLRAAVMAVRVSQPSVGDAALGSPSGLCHELFHGFCWANGLFARPFLRMWLRNEKNET